MQGKKIQVKSKEQVLNFQNSIFRHLTGLPAEQIEQAVILVSLSNQPIVVFEKITTKTYHEMQKKHPMMSKINKDTTVIYTTQAFLNPKISHNFVSMHYLMRTVKRAKFIFIFNQANFNAKGLPSIRDALQALTALFHDKDIKRFGKRLSECTGFIIHQSGNGNQDLSAYLKTFQTVYTQKQLIKNEEVKEFAKSLGQKQKGIILKKNSQTVQFTKQFCRMVDTLKYMELQDKVNLKQESSFHQYVDVNISRYWQDFFKLLYSSLIALIEEEEEEPQQVCINYKPQKQKVKQSELLAKLQDFVFFQQEFVNKTYVIEQNKYKILRLCNFMHCYLDIINSFETQIPNENSWFQSNQNNIKKLLRGLYESRYLTQGVIQFYLLSYFKIYKFLSTNNSNDPTTDIFLIVQFNSQLKKPQLFLDKMPKMINILFNLIENELVSNLQNSSYPTLIKSLNSLLLKFQNKRYSFITERTIKKIKKFIAQIAFKRAETAALAYNIPPSEINKQWLQFLHLAINLTLIDSSKIEKAIYYLADELTKVKEYQLSLRIFHSMPLFKVYKKVIAIYERDLKFNPQIMKYTLTIDWTNKREQFFNYCNFLLQLGFTQKVRGIVLQAMRIIQDEQSLQNLKGMLANVMSDDSRNLHIKFLQDTNEMDRSFVEENILDQIAYGLNNKNRFE